MRSVLRRGGRLLVVLIYAVALASWLTLADLQTSYSQEPNELRYVVVALPGVVGLVLLAGWHALWLMPLVTQAFAEVYEAYWWTPPAGIRDGMDYVSWYPSNVGLVMLVAVPFATLVALARRPLLDRWREKRRGRFAY
jgi:hypothetical protein